MLTTDYIIIGGGTAACILANRLSKNPANEVLLLESGKQPDNAKFKIPASFNQLFKTRYDWNYNTVPQKHVKNRQMYQPRGKVLGGCTQINAMIYIRGAHQDYQDWQELGNHLWSYDKVLPYFIKGKNNTAVESSYHQKGGEQFISKLRVSNPLTKDFIEAAQQQGIALNNDFNGKEQLGVGPYHVFQKNGSRYSVYDAFLKPVLKRKNLRIITSAHVEKIIFKDKAASKVSFNLNGKQTKAQARREIILCAGTFGSAQILLRSGVGPANHLNDLGIDVVYDSPEVGNNLQDHLAFGINVETKSKYSYDGIDKFPAVITPLIQYLFFNRGPLTSNIAEAGAFIKSDPNLSAADLQLLFAPANFIKHGLLDLGNYKGMTLGACHLQPKSRGTVRLKSKSLRAPILIDPNYLYDEHDQEVIVKGFLKVQDILHTSPLKKHIVRQKYPTKKLENPDEIMDFLKTFIQTLYHPVGTCKMGLGFDSVVDQKLRVQGVSKLRVADASVMPKIIRGNTQAPVMMIAERAADFILQDRLTLSSKMIY